MEHSEYFQTLKEFFYNKNEHYMVRSSAAYSVASLNKFSGEKKKAIKTLFDIMRSAPEKDVNSRLFMENRASLSLQKLTGKDFHKREEWYSKNKGKKFSNL